MQNNTGKNLNLKNGRDVANGGYVYYTAKLANKDGKRVFEKATTTLLNANIQDWGNGTTTHLRRRTCSSVSSLTCSGNKVSCTTWIFNAIPFRALSQRVPCSFVCKAGLAARAVFNYRMNRIE